MPVRITTHARSSLSVRLKDVSRAITPLAIVLLGEEFQKPYDAVITATGWRWDNSALDSTVEVEMMGPPNRVRMMSVIDSVIHHNLPTRPV